MENQHVNVNKDIKIVLSTIYENNRNISKVKKKKDLFNKTKWNQFNLSLPDLTAMNLSSMKNASGYWKVKGGKYKPGLGLKM